MTRKLTLLYLDDDPSAIQYLQKLLHKYGTQIEPQFTGSPKAALDTHRKKPFDIVISDLRLGSTTGIEVVTQMRSFAPDTAYILVSGDADLDSALAAVNAAKAVRFLVKPCTEEQLAEALADATRHLEKTSHLQRASLSDQVLRQTNTAIISLDRQFNLTYVNECASELLQDSDILSLSPTGALMSNGEWSTHELKDRLKEATLSPEKRGLPFACHDREFQNKLVIYPILEEEAGTELEFSFILIDPSRSRNLTPHQLAAVLNLSMSEARVVNHLALGLSVEETAEACNLSLSTVRTYLKNACAKAGVSRQAEIVAMALRSAI